jgi:hypothetical protein
MIFLYLLKDTLKKKLAIRCSVHAWLQRISPHALTSSTNPNQS